MEKDNLKYSILLSLLLTFGFIFPSCSSDDEDKNDSNNTDNHLIINSDRIDEAGASNLDGVEFAIDYTKSSKKLEIIANFFWGGYANGKDRSFGVYIYDTNIEDIPINTNLIASSSSVKSSAYYFNATWSRTVWNEKGIGEIILKERDMQNNTLLFEFKNIKFDDTPTNSGDGIVNVSGLVKSKIKHF